MRKSVRAAAVAVVAAVAMALSGCGNDSGASSNGASGSLTPVTFQLNWAAGGVNSGFAMAKKQGLYEQAGLDVTIIEGNGSANTAQLVASNQAQIAYADAVSVSQLIAKGAAMRNISTIYQSSPNQVTARADTDIQSIGDLKGHRVGVPSGSSQTPMLPLLFEANGLKESDMTLVNMPNTSMVPALLQGEVDAILGSVDAYGIQLAQQGAETRNWLFSDYGVPTVSTGIFASDQYLSENPDVVKKFVAASLKGWQQAMADPEAAIDAVKDQFPETNRDLATAELASIEPLYCAAGAKFVGKAEPESWARTQELLSQVDLLPAGQDPTTYYTYDFLPGESEMQACVDGKPQAAVSQ
jgi:NitT/TauT family transport system substrate-binding protein